MSEEESDFLGMEFVVDPNNVQQENTVIPEGTYNVIVAKSSRADTKNRTGIILKLMLTVMDGEYKGANVFANINLANNDDRAVEIGRKDLNSLLVATKVEKFSFASQVLGKQLSVVTWVKPGTIKLGTDGKPVKDSKGNDTYYPDKTEVKYYKGLPEGYVPSATPPRTVAPPQPQAKLATAPISAIRPAFMPIATNSQPVQGNQYLPPDDDDMPF